MRIQTFLKAAALASLLASLPAGAQQSDRADGMRFVPNVLEQFQALTEYADPLGFHRSTTPNPSHCRHYQAITRVDGADGTPFFLVSRSGNRLRKGVHVDNTAPPAEDVATIFFTVVGGDPDDPDPARRPGLVLGHGEGPGPVQRVYGHPGGMQLVGHMLALANESPKDLGGSLEDAALRALPTRPSSGSLSEVPPAPSPRSGGPIRWRGRR